MSKIKFQREPSFDHHAGRQDVTANPCYRGLGQHSAMEINNGCGNTEQMMAHDGVGRGHFGAGGQQFSFQSASQQMLQDQ